jgi:hypothetical protein
MRPQTILAALGAVLCKILQTNFGE